MYKLLLVKLCLAASVCSAMDDNILSTSNPSSPRQHVLSQEDHDKDYIESKLLPVIRQVVSHPIYQDYNSFITNRNMAGFKEGMSLDAFRQLVLDVHGKKLELLGVSIEPYQPYILTTPIVETITVKKDEKVQLTETDITDVEEKKESTSGSISTKTPLDEKRELLSELEEQIKTLGGRKNKTARNQKNRQITTLKKEIQQLESGL